MNQPFRIQEITQIDSPYLPGMVNWLVKVFPDYEPSFNRILSSLRHPNGRHEGQLFVGLCGEVVAGLVQSFYRPWQYGLLGYIDLLGVLEPYRRSGLGSELVMQAIQATRDISGCYEIPALGVVSLADPNYSPIIRLHQKLGGQVRMDLDYRGGDIVVWYPFSEHMSGVSTKVLTWQLWQFGGLPEEEFFSEYGRFENEQAGGY